MSSFAATRRINPVGVVPKLTVEQVWKGLGIKARKPSTFVPVITSCEIVSDDGTNVVRRVQFNNGDPVDEKIELHASTIAYFEIAATGQRITNIVSYDEDGELLLTFTFANGIPGHGDAKEVVGKTVEHSIKRLRELAVAGEI